MVRSCSVYETWFELAAKGLTTLSDTPILLSEHEFAHYNKDGILLADGSGYLATITMYHDLHCIVRINNGHNGPKYFVDSG